jgi:hypothetical protein
MSGGSLFIHSKINWVSMSLFSISGFRNQAQHSKNELIHALRKSRKKNTISKQDRALLKKAKARDLCSVNHFARIRWGKAFCGELGNFFRFDGENPFPDQPLFFVTLSDISCTTSQDASFVDVCAFKRKLQAGLRGLSYVGMMEPGLFVNISAESRWAGRSAVSWHVHAICWGENRKEMKRRFRRLNENGGYLALLPSQLGAHQTEIPNTCLPDNPERTFLADKLRYLLKSPQKAYRVYKTSRIEKNAELVPCVRQRKSELRKGDRITLFHLMKSLRLGELAVAGGEGTNLMRRIKRRAVLIRGPWSSL